MTNAVVLGEGYLAERTRRALSLQGLHPTIVRDLASAAVLFARDEPIFLLRAGAFPREALRPPPPSATGQPVVAVAGSMHGGSLAGLAPEAVVERLASAGDLPACIYLQSPRGLAEAESLGAWLRARRVRGVPLAGAPVAFDERVRVALVVTTLHRGGAERVVLSLRERLAEQGLVPLLAVLDRPRRASYPTPSGTLELITIAHDRADRLAALGELWRRAGVDVAHLHLLSGEESRSLAETGVPVVVTLHNAVQGWQRGQAELRAGDVDLVLPCSRSADRDAQAVGLSVPRRLAWNGIDPARLPTLDRTDEARQAQRRVALGLPADHRGPVLLALANPRPQKRLERLPAILQALVLRGVDARLLIAGEIVGTDAPSRASIEAFDAVVHEAGLAARIARPGPQDDLGALFAVSDVLVSTSAHEGLSIAQLEAVAVGLPLVVTDVGGADETARLHPGRVTLLDREASAEAFAEAIVAALLLPRENGRKTALAPAFTDRAMARRHAGLYRRVIAARRARRSDLVIVANNLVVGGAQTSARKLLAALSAEGLAVSAAVIEEHPDKPSVGRRALEAAGIAVFATASARTHDPAAVFAELLAHLDQRAPRNVFFWNLRPSFRTRLADALLGTRVVDVSPGVMSFDALERHFARAHEPRREPAELLSTHDYGRLLASAVVKYRGEEARARALLGAPVVVIPNGVALPSQEEIDAAWATQSARGGRKGMVFGTACRLSPDKCLEQLLDAFRLVCAREPDCSLRIAGGDDPGHEGYGEALRASVADLPVVFVGEQRSLAAFHASVDVFVVIAEPAGCPNASLEAMAAGLPTVITDVGGARDQIDHERTGLLTPAGDHAALAEAMQRLSRDAALRQRLGAAGRAEMAARFSVGAMTSAYRALLAFS